MRDKSKSELKKLMAVSDSIADLNNKRFKDFIGADDIGQAKAEDIVRPAVRPKGSLGCLPNCLLCYCLYLSHSSPSTLLPLARLVRVRYSCFIPLLTNASVVITSRTRRLDWLSQGAYCSHFISIITRRIIGSFDYYFRR